MLFHVNETMDLTYLEDPMLLLWAK